MQFPCALFTETRRQRLPAGFCQCESKAKFSDFRGSCIFYLTSSSPLWRESKNTFSLVCRLRAVRVSQAIRGRKKKKKKGSNHLFFPLLVQSAGLLSCLSVFQKCILKILHRVDMFNRKTCGSCRAAFRQLILRGCTAQEIFCWGIIVAQ